MHTNLAGNMGGYDVTVIQIYLENGIWQYLCNDAFALNYVFLSQNYSSFSGACFAFSASNSRSAARSCLLVTAEISVTDDLPSILICFSFFFSVKRQDESVRRHSKHTRRRLQLRRRCYSYLCLTVKAQQNLYNRPSGMDFLHYSIR